MISFPRTYQWPFVQTWYHYLYHWYKRFEIWMIKLFSPSLSALSHLEFIFLVTRQWQGWSISDMYIIRNPCFSFICHIFFEDIVFRSLSSFSSDLYDNKLSMVLGSDKSWSWLVVTSARSCVKERSTDNRWDDIRPLIANTFIDSILLQLRRVSRKQ